MEKQNNMNKMFRLGRLLPAAVFSRSRIYFIILYTYKAATVVVSTRSNISLCALDSRFTAVVAYTHMLEWNKLVPYMSIYYILCMCERVMASDDFFFY